MAKRILTMQDLSCVGQCSLTVALPVLSAYGVEAAVLPTALLSNHTMFKTWSYLDLTPEIESIYGKWRENGFLFDGFLLGYLGKSSLMDLAEKCFDDFSGEGAKIIIDPAFGDNGKLYGGFDGEYVKAMANLIRRADVILPNITEASYLTGIPYREKYGRDYVEKLLKGLARLTSGAVIITGVEENGMIGEAIYAGGETEYVTAELLPARLHGTGDIFAAVFAAEYLNGAPLSESCAAAGDFVARCIKRTEPSHFYGACFEDVLAEKEGGNAQ